MNLQELRELAAHYAGLTSSTAAGDFNSIITPLLNAAQVRHGRRLRVPRQYVTLTGVTTATVTLPITPYASNGLISVFDLTNKNRLPIYRPYEADNEWPDRASAPPGVPSMVEWDQTNPATLTIYPTPSTPVDLRVFIAYDPPQMQVAADQPWSGQFPEHHELIAVSAALEYVEKRIGDDAETLVADRNPYAPLNAVRWLRGKLDALEKEAFNALVPVLSVPTANRRLTFRNSGYRWTRT